MSLHPDFEAYLLSPTSVYKYFLQHELFEVWHLAEEGNTGQFSTGFEGGTVSYYVISDVLLEMCASHIIILLQDLMVQNGVCQPFYLMSRHFQLTFYVPYILLREENSPILIDFCFTHRFLDLRKIEYTCTQNQLQLLIVPQTLILEAGDLSGNLEAILILQRYPIHKVQKLLPVPSFLIGRQYEYLTNPVPLLHRRQSKHIFREHSNHILSLLALYPLIDHIVDPGIELLEHKGDTIDIEQKQHLQSLLERVECFIVAVVLHQLEFILSPCVGVEDLPWGLGEILLFFLSFQPVILLAESLPPPLEGDPVVALVVIEDVLDGL